MGWGDMARGGGGDMTITSSSGLAHREGEQPNVERKINRRNFLFVDQIDHTTFFTCMPLIRRLLVTKLHR